MQTTRVFTQTPRRAFRFAFRTRRPGPANDNAAAVTAAAAAAAMIGAYAGMLARAGTPGLALRHALALLADDPALRSPGAALARLRPLAAAERAALAQSHAAARTAYGIGHAGLIDAAAAGLLDLARAYVGWGGWSEAAPLAAVAIGDYARAALTPGAAPELLFVVPDVGRHTGDRDSNARDPVARDRAPRNRAAADRERRSGERMAAFAMIGFADLGLDMRCAVRGVADCAALAADDPGATRARRFVWGRYDLFVKLAEALPAPASALGVDAAGGPV